MPKKKEEEVLQLRAENALLRKLVEDLRKQVEELVKQITIMQMQLKDSHESKAEQTQQTAALQGKLDELLFQLKNLNRKEYGSKNEHHLSLWSRYMNFLSARCFCPK